MQTDQSSTSPFQCHSNTIVDKSRKHRIVHVVSSLKVGGMEHFVLRMAAAQQAAGYRTSILAIQGGPLHQEAVRLGLDCNILGGTRKALRAVKGACIIARLRPEIIHVHNQTSLHYAALGKRVSGAKVVMTNHGQGIGSSRTPTAQEWLATDAIVTVSRAVAEGMDLLNLGSKVTTIYNGISLSPSLRSSAEIRKTLGIPSERFVGTLVARIDGLKGHDTLIHALARLKAAGLAFTFLVAGDGAERTAIEALACGLGLNSDAVRFLGFRDDIPDLLGASDVFVLPSLTEGLPLSVLEAMSHRLPIVATRVGGIPELVGHGIHGLLVPPNDAEALADAITRIINDPDKRHTFGDAGSRRALADFSFEKMIDAYRDLYCRLFYLPVRASR
jgi:glycosyltransferase involved in cell wall biosynthesis